MTTVITQVTATVSESSTSLFTTTVTTTDTAAPSTTFVPDPVIPIALANNYTCAPGANLQAVLATMQSVLMRTDSQLIHAGLIILVLNLHTLPSIASSNMLYPSIPDDLSLSEQINKTLGDWLYTPTALAFEREDISATFLADTAHPIIDMLAYYDVKLYRTSKIASTPNGWPSTRHLFKMQGRRLLIGFGTVNVAHKDYDINQDTPIIFPPATFGGQDQLIPANDITNRPDSCLGPQGPIFGPTGEQAFDRTTGISGNMTFALSEDPNPVDPPSFDSLQGIVTCGLSPIIASPMRNTNSGEMSPILPIAGTVWSWLPPNEPHNTSPPANSARELLACAALDADTGHWVVLERNTRLNIACRVNNSLYLVSSLV